MLRQKARAGNENECYSQLVTLAASPLLSAISVPSMALAAVPRGQSARICGFRMSAPEQAWLDALGLPVGETVMVLRQAPFGGPMHVRAGSGAEFALDLQCAACIDVVLAAVVPSPRS